MTSLLVLFMIQLHVYWSDVDIRSDACRERLGFGVGRRALCMHTSFLRRGALWRARHLIIVV